MYSVINGGGKARLRPEDSGLRRVKRPTQNTTFDFSLLKIPRTNLKQQQIAKGDFQ